MKAAWIWMAVCLPLNVFAGIDLSLSRSSCLPGDMVELRAESRSAQLTHFEIKLPKHEALHVVAHQRHPLRYEDGAYSQKDVWVVQPLQAGEIRLEGLKAVMQNGDEASEWLIEDVPVLKVGAYSKSDDSLIAQPLPSVAVEIIENGRAIILLVLAFIGALIILYFSFRSRQLSAVDASEPERSLEGLLALLNAEEPVNDYSEMILGDGSIVLSRELRDALEQIVYGGSEDVERVREILSKEVLS